MFRPIERMLPTTFPNVLLKVNLAFYQRKIGWLHREKFRRKEALSADRMLFMNSHLSLEVQLKHKMSLMPSRNYNKKPFRSVFTKRGQEMSCVLYIFSFVKNAAFRVNTTLKFNMLSK